MQQGRQGGVLDGLRRTAEMAEAEYHARRMASLREALAGVTQGIEKVLAPESKAGDDARALATATRSIPVAINELANVGVEEMAKLRAGLQAFTDASAVAAAAANRQASSLTHATWALVIATGVLAAATVALVLVTAS